MASTHLASSSLHPVTTTVLQLTPDPSSLCFYLIFIYLNGRPHEPRATKARAAQRSPVPNSTRERSGAAGNWGEHKQFAPEAAAVQETNRVISRDKWRRPLWRQVVSQSVEGLGPLPLPFTSNAGILPALELDLSPSCKQRGQKQTQRSPLL